MSQRYLELATTVFVWGLFVGTLCLAVVGMDRYYAKKEKDNAAS